MQLHTLGPVKGAHKRRKILGRGRSSGHGKTSCRGQKGQGARTGSRAHPGFEGRQTPLIRRIPKRGFTHKPKEKIKIINIKELLRFPPNSAIYRETLKEQGLIKDNDVLIKILGDGEINYPLTLKVQLISSSAKEKIVKAGGKVEITE